MSRAHFDGAEYEPKKDFSRLNKQIEVICMLMLDDEWRTLPEIEAETGYLTSSISAQLRNLRKERFGGWIVEKRRRTEQGLFEYRVVAKDK